MSTQNQNKRIAKNTLLLYVRQLLILFTSLYTIRIVLNVLGVNDYGIYNVVAGIVLTFSFLNQTMASATQRYFSFALGENDLEKLEKIFSVNFIIYIAIALFAVCLLVTAIVVTAVLSGVRRGDKSAREPIVGESADDGGNEFATMETADDKGHEDIARKAVDEYLEKYDVKLLLNRIDYTGRIAVRVD